MANKQPHSALNCQSLFKQIANRHGAEVEYLNEYLKMREKALKNKECSDSNSSGRII
ncbi:hypothetical protein [Acinetobacter sp.]|jgi:hypothetical protein|uniref:hypothetical protein n=1 Tax=Acinetobacter sp. TaxID=472 RepID=UPI0035B0601A